VSAGEHRLGYAFSLGNGRSNNPAQNMFARDDDGWRSATGMLEWWAPWAREMRLGVSGWADRIRSHHVNQLGEVRNITDPTTESIELRELGVGGHFVLKTQWLNVIAEVLYQRHDDLLHNLPKGENHPHLFGGLFEVSANLGPEGVIKPYVRYDVVQLHGSDPYLGLRADGRELTRVPVYDVSLGMIGVAWDAARSCRLKLEYSRAFTGPREVNSVIAQSAFAF
jgi:hypothetical protein